MDTYQGPYNIKPKIKRKRRARCRHKIASQDFTIKEIQKSITSNPAGGLTFYVRKDSEIIDGV